MPAPTRFTNGVTTVPKTNVLGYFGLPDPTEFHTYFEDFDTYTAGDWTVTETQAGATQALTDGDGGQLLLTNSAADNDLVSLQKVGESFKFEAGKKLWFKARFKVSDATQSDFVVGLVITDTTPLDVTDGVFFMKDDGDTNLDFHVEKNNTATSATAIATVGTSFFTVGFYYNGVDKVHYFVDGVEKGYSAVTNLVDDEELAVTVAIQNGEAAAKTMTVDYIFVAKER